MSAAALSGGTRWRHPVAARAVGGRGMRASVGGAWSIGRGCTSGAMLDIVRAACAVLCMSGSSGIWEGERPTAAAACAAARA